LRIDELKRHAADLSGTSKIAKSFPGVEFTKGKLKG
jgi:hypothetical protein